MKSAKNDSQFKTAESAANDFLLRGNDMTEEQWYYYGLGWNTARAIESTGEKKRVK